MNRYEEYKVSAIKWLPEIPAHWEVIPLRHLGNLYGGLTGKKAEHFNQDGHECNKPFIPFTNIFKNYYVDTNDFQSVIIEDDELQNKVQLNDLFFLMSSENYEDLGKNALLKGEEKELYLNSFCKGFRIKSKKVYPQYLNYLFLGNLHKEMISIEGNGFTRINLRQEGLLKVPVLIPPIEEQRKIAEFLDKEIIRLEALIKKKKQLINRLNEKRQSVISRSVTEGVRKQSRLVSSGIEWLGDIPENWEKKKLKYIFRGFESGVSVNSIDTPASDLEIGVLKTSCVYTYSFNSKENKTVIPDDIERVACPVKGDSIIMSRMNTPDLVGASGYVEEDIDNIYLPDRLWQTVAWQHLKVHFKWLSFVFISAGFKSVVSSLATGTSPSMKNIKQSDVMNITIGLPEYEEQIEIAEFIQSTIDRIDEVISKNRLSINKLEAYKNSLISEAVIGEIKVID